MTTANESPRQQNDLVRGKVATDKDYAELQRFADPVEDVTLVYDNESGTVLAVEDCMILTMHPEFAEQLSEGTFDLEAIPSPSSDLPATNGMNARAALALLEAASVLITNAEYSPDPRMSNTTDCYIIPLDDVDALRQAITDAVGGQVAGMLAIAHDEWKDTHLVGRRGSDPLDTDR